MALAPPPAPAARPAPAPSARTTTTGVIEPPAPLPHLDLTEYRHDGFYFRIGLGFGSLGGSVSQPDAGDEEFDLSGFASLGEVSFGGTVAPGLVLGGGSFSVNVPTLTLSNESQTVDSNALGVSLFAFFADYYFDPRRGFHAQAGVGATLLSAEEGDEEGLVDDFFGPGFGVMMGVGYEGFVGKQWSLGALARLIWSSGSLYAVSSDEDDLDMSVLIPGVMLTATYH